MTFSTLIDFTKFWTCKLKMIIFVSKIENIKSDERLKLKYFLVIFIFIFQFLSNHICEGFFTESIIMKVFFQPYIINVHNNVLYFKTKFQIIYFHIQLHKYTLQNFSLLLILQRYLTRSCHWKLNEKPKYSTFE